MKIDGGFLSKSQIGPMGIFFLEFGLRYKKNGSKWQKQRKNVLVRHKKNKNLHKGYKNSAKIRYFEIDHSVPHSCYVNKKVAEKGYVQPDIGPEWRKVAEIG